MKIKSYRAETLRAALMQIKEELGEDALVLETKRVKAGGLFGVGARDLVEVRVAPNPYQEEPKKKAPPTSLRDRLDLTDDSEAAPTTKTAVPNPTGRSNDFERELARNLDQTTGFQMDEQSLKAFASLAARAYSNGSDGNQSESKPRRKTAAPIPTRRPNDYSSSRVEIAETAPRIVHPKGMAPRPAQRPMPSQAQSYTQGQAQNRATAYPPAPPVPPPVQPRAPKATAAPANNFENNSERQAVDTELARLRAELREMKLALGAFAARPSTLSEEREQGFSESSQAAAMFVQGPDYEMFQELRRAGVSKKFAQQAVKQARGLGESADIATRARMALTAALPTWIEFAESAMPLQEAIAFIGATGVGKTTTIAKLAAHVALRAKQRVELVTLDTYRIAAVQQLKTYAEIIGAGCHIAHSVKELNAIVQRFAGIATVMIDTTGRSPHDLADQFELADYLRQHPQIIKCMVLTATSHPEDAQLVIDKYALYGANRLALTKLDETVQPGAAIAMAASAGLPLMYLCAGQRVPEDLERATPSNFAQRILRQRVMARAA